jgi:hypothetical protein
MGLFDGAGGGGLFGRRPAAAPGADPDAAYQMPRLPYAQNDFVTLAALGMIGAPNIDQAMQNVAQIAPAGLASNTAKRRDMYSIQEKNAERARQTAAMNAGLKLLSDMPLTEAETAALAASPEIALKFEEMRRKTNDPVVVAKGAKVYVPGQGWIEPPGGGAVEPPDFNERSGFRKEAAALPSYQRLAETHTTFRDMVKTAHIDTRAADLDLVYGMAKLLDPLGAVRGEDSVQVANTANLPDWLMGEINSLNSNKAGRMLPGTRNNIMQIAQHRMNELQSAWQTDYDRLKEIAGGTGVPLTDIPNIPPIPTYVPITVAPDTNLPKP